MPCPTKNDLLIGFLFVIAGVIHELCDGWAARMKVEGKSTMKTHYFTHSFFVWTLKQILLAFLLPLWKAIDKNFMGVMGRFKHAEFKQPGRHNVHILGGNQHFNNDRDRQVNPVHVQPINQEIDPADDNEENDQQNLIQQDQPQPVFHRRAKKYTKFLFFLPAVFNQAHIILIFFGMRLTYPSTKIMLKGTEPIFIYLLALAFLAQQIAIFKWVALFVVASGFAISGLSDYIHIVPDGYEPYGIAAGGLLYTMSQITLTTMMIYEEKFMRKLSIHPMKFLGAQGVYSMIFSIICLIIFNFVDTVRYTEQPIHRMEDVLDALTQLYNCWHLIIAVVGSVVGYVIYMYLGMLIIKEHGAVTRVMISMLPAALFWAISIGVKWQNFYITQVPGLVMVPIGLLIYSHILVSPCLQNGAAGNIGPNDFFIIDNEQDQRPIEIDNVEVGANDDGEVPQCGMAAGRDEQLIRDVGANDPGMVAYDEPLIQA